MGMYLGISNMYIPVNDSKAGGKRTRVGDFLGILLTTILVWAMLVYYYNVVEEKPHAAVVQPIGELVVEKPQQVAPLYESPPVEQKPVGDPIIKAKPVQKHHTVLTIKKAKHVSKVQAKPLRVPHFVVESSLVEIENLWDHYCSNAANHGRCNKS